MTRKSGPLAGGGNCREGVDWQELQQGSCGGAVDSPMYDSGKSKNHDTLNKRLLEITELPKAQRASSRNPLRIGRYNVNG